MGKVKAYDVDGTEIKKGDLVQIVAEPNVKHAWLKVGNTLRVGDWEDRRMGRKEEYIVVFLKSKSGGKYCQTGIQDKRLKVVEG